MHGRAFRRCDDICRRDFITAGCLTALGFGLANHATIAARKASRQADSCILIWLDGGPSHLDTFDLKPQAPVEVRGPFQSIPTRVPGMEICELLPETAMVADKLAIIRSMTSPLGEHNFGTHYLMTGYKPSPALEYPQYGSVLAHLRQKQGQQAVLPDHIAVPDFRVGGSKLTGNGYLPEACRPFSIDADPSKPDFRVRDLDLYPMVTAARLERRREFLQTLDRFSRAAEASQTTNPGFKQAYRLTMSAEAKRAFDLNEEPSDLRQRYGSKSIGQCCLLARRLVERGAPFVTVNNAGWDTHDNAYTRLKEGYTRAKVGVGLIPSLDLALSALITDLQERGMLERTLVVVMGEFGRTPKVNTAGGRDHWPRVFSVVLAGGGMAGGQIIGSSDAGGESPKDRPVTPEDLAATIYSLLGISPEMELHTADGRPVRINADGTVLREIFEGA